MNDITITFPGTLVNFLVNFSIFGVVILLVIYFSMVRGTKNG